MSSAALAVEAIGLAAQSATRKRKPLKWQRHLEAVRSCPPGRQPVLVAALATTYPEVLPAYKLLDTSTEPASLVQAHSVYPRCSVQQSARLLLGETPEAISRGLTRKEAHQWLTEAPEWLAGDWLLRKAGLDACARSVAVARWAIECDKDPQRRAALWRARTARGPHGEEINGSLISRLDELQAVDLRPSVRETFERAGRRLLRQTERLMRRKAEPLAPPPAWWQPVRCARLLLSPAELFVEGRQMRHCVALYGRYVRSRQSVIVALDVLGYRSTVEMDRKTLQVKQHKGRDNLPPPELCERALRVCLRRWRRKGRME